MESSKQVHRSTGHPTLLQVSIGFVTDCTKRGNGDLDFVTSNNNYSLCFIIICKVSETMYEQTHTHTHEEMYAYILSSDLNALIHEHQTRVDRHAQ